MSRAKPDWLPDTSDSGSEPQDQVSDNWGRPRWGYGSSGSTESFTPPTSGTRWYDEQSESHETIELNSAQTEGSLLRGSSGRRPSGSVRSANESVTGGRSGRSRAPSTDPDKLRLLEYKAGKPFCLTFFGLLHFITTASGVLAAAGQILSLVAIYEINHGVALNLTFPELWSLVQSVCLRVYGVVFSFLVVATELSEFGPCKKCLARCYDNAATKHWWARGLLYVFVGLFAQQGAKDFHHPRGQGDGGGTDASLWLDDGQGQDGGGGAGNGVLVENLRALQVIHYSALVLMAAGAFYTLLGALCCKALKDMQVREHERAKTDLKTYLEKQSTKAEQGSGGGAKSSALRAQGSQGGDANKKGAPGWWKPSSSGAGGGSRSSSVSPRAGGVAAAAVDSRPTDWTQPGRAPSPPPYQRPQAAPRQSSPRVARASPNSEVNPNGGSRGGGRAAGAQPFRASADGGGYGGAFSQAYPGAPSSQQQSPQHGGPAIMRSDESGDHEAGADEGHSDGEDSAVSSLTTPTTYGGPPLGAERSAYIGGGGSRGQSKPSGAPLYESLAVDDGGTQSKSTSSAAQHRQRKSRGADAAAGPGFQPQQGRHAASSAHRSPGGRPGGGNPGGGAGFGEFDASSAALVGSLAGGGYEDERETSGERLLNFLGMTGRNPTSPRMSSVGRQSSRGSQQNENEWQAIP